jgi:hypothetical protein
MKNKTAIEWFVEQVESISNSKGVSRTETIELYNDAIQKAKAMEKQQIIKAYIESDSISASYNLEPLKSWAKDYYNETYGGDE